METPNWGNLILLSEWATTLQALLTATEIAINGSESQRQEMEDLLQTFIRKSPFSAAALDTVATNAIIALNIAAIGEAINAIHKANDELKKQIDLINGVTMQAQDDAKKLRLDDVNKVLSDAKPILTAFRKVNDKLGKSDDGTTERIDAVIKALEELAE